MLDGACTSLSTKGICRSHDLASAWGWTSQVALLSATTYDTAFAKASSFFFAYDTATWRTSSIKKSWYQDCESLMIHIFQSFTSIGCPFRREVFQFWWGWDFEFQNLTLLSSFLSSIHDWRGPREVSDLKPFAKMTEMMVYYDGTADFEESAAKRQRLGDGCLHLTPLSGVIEPIFSATSQFQDQRADSKQNNLKNTWALSFLPTQNNEFAFSGYEAPDHNITENQDSMGDAPSRDLTQETSYRAEYSEVHPQSSYHQDFLNSAGIEGNGTVDQLSELATPTIDQLCFGMVISRRGLRW